MDERPIVYIGFGSIIVPDPVTFMNAVIASVAKANVRAIVSKGWYVKYHKCDTYMCIYRFIGLLGQSKKSQFETRQIRLWKTR